MASFVLGAVAMTSVNASVAQPAAAFTSSKKASITNVHISLDSTNGDKCLTLNGDGDLILNKCGNGDGSGSHSKQRFTYTHKGNSGRIVALHPEDQSVNTVQPAVSCSEYSLPCDMYLWFATSDSEEPGQNLFWDPSTKHIKTGCGFCMTAEGSKNGKKILAEKCNGKAKLQQWQIGDAPAPPPHDGPSCPTGMYDTGGWKQAGGDSLEMRRRLRGRRGPLRREDSRTETAIAPVSVRAVIRPSSETAPGRANRRR